MTITIPKLNEWQLDCWKDIVDESSKGKVFCVKSKRQVGKSFLAEMLLIYFSLTKKCTCCIAEPTLSQSRRCFKDIVGYLEGSGAIKNANASLLTIDFVNGSEILFKSAEQRDALRGFTVTGLLIIDEAAFWPSETIDIILPVVDAHAAPLLFISTPLFTDGRFYEYYSKGLEEGGLIKSYDWSEYDTSKYLTKEKLELYRKQMAENKFRTEYLGEFITDGSMVFGNVLSRIGITMGEPIYAGVDWANGGDNDFTVVTFLNINGDVLRIYAFNDMTPTEQLNTISNILNSTPTLTKIQVELNSIGTVYYDLLKGKLKNKNALMGFNTTNESKRRIIEQLMTAFQNGTITIIEDKELIKELQHYAVEKTKTGYTYNGIGAHDDYVMSLAMAYDLTVNNKGTYSVKTYVPKKKKKSLKEKYG